MMTRISLRISSLRTTDDRCIGRQRKVNTWVGDQVGLKFSQIDVQCTIEAERGGDR